MKQKQKGFTLIELLVVIAIIGLLAGIVLVSLGGARQSAQDARRQTDIRNMGTAMELCYNNVACGAANQYLTDAGPSVPGALGAGMPITPVDPTTAAAYGWEDNTGNNQSYCLHALLSNATDYFCASERGVQTSATAPTLADCCGL